MAANNYAEMVDELETAEEHIANAVYAADEATMTSDEAYATSNLGALTTGLIKSIESRVNDDQEDYEPTDQVKFLLSNSEE